MQSLSHKSEFDLDENEPVEETNFQMNGFTQRLILMHRQLRSALLKHSTFKSVVYTVELVILSRKDSQFATAMMHIITVSVMIATAVV